MTLWNVWNTAVVQRRVAGEGNLSANSSLHRCNKHYMKTQSPSVPGGNFPVPAKSTTPLLALRCSQAIRPYLPEDTGNTDGSVAILIDTPVVFSHISNAAAITIANPASPGSLSVTVNVDGKTLTTGTVPLNATKHALTFSLSSLTPRKAAYSISCTATHSSQTFHATGSLTYLPALPSGIGSVTKMDQRTGALLARPANGKGGAYAPVFPIGFYTQFDNYLATDFTIPAKLKSQGFTVIHPVPDFANMTAFDLVLDKMQDAGIYLMYDMRNTYMNSTSVTTQVNHIKSRPNLLLWYTGDEPDGTSDPLNATVTASNLITSLDGGDGVGGAGYHPVSLVLNCQDYQFNSYAAGSDIVMQDAYTIGNNVTFSTVWGTPCTTDYGDCGCDNCKGSFADISTRMDEFKDRLFINGWDRTKAVWTVPQGFGNDTYVCSRFPTGKEFVVESVVGMNHGGLGVVSWDDPTSAEIKASASALALALPNMTSFILSPRATFKQVTTNGIDAGMWTIGSQTLVLASNTNYASVVLRLQDLGFPATVGSITQVFNSGTEVDSARFHLIFESVGSGGFIVQK
ncbi:hypothetical protein BDQ12DRAFT_610474 [Crucibulum laeve]|uniref:Glycoside hydrolase superfamily n=1 Tax=Crucibulum laeve TaxID=68775 RepID=A0A5C3LU89_9AGAR|nr:hypothetical protein BDQ12DRAFT_610474 [Crucibulum laeve]